jgi:hypothetical protein
METQMRTIKGWTAVLAVGTLTGCAALGLGGIIEPPRFDTAPGQSAELRLAAPSAQAPLGGATIRLWARVENPNSFGFTLARLAGTLFLDASRAATLDLPLGLPLRAGQDTIFPIDLTVSFSDLPGLADVAMRAFAGQSLNYRLDGTVGVNAGALGQPTFGPLTLLQGQVDTR